MNTVLHIVNKAAMDKQQMPGWLIHINQSDGLLFIEDGVYNCIQNTQTQPLFKNQAANVYVLTADLLARGFNRSAVFDFIQPIDYPGFVDLSLNYASSLSWS